MDHMLSLIYIHVIPCTSMYMYRYVCIPAELYIIYLYRILKLWVLFLIGFFQVGCLLCLADNYPLIMHTVCVLIRRNVIQLKYFLSIPVDHVTYSYSMATLLSGKGHLVILVVTVQLLVVACPTL